MAELARMHGDKQIWLTRGHLAALATTTLFIAVLSFFVGLQLGQRHSSHSSQDVTPLLLPDPAKEDALEALLRQVEVAQAEGASATDLTFPQALGSGKAPQPPQDALDSVQRSSTVTPPPDISAPTPEALPPLPARDGWSIQAFSFQDVSEASDKVAFLNEAGWTTYQVTALVQGENWHRVRVGGYPSKEAATEAAAELATNLGLEELMITQAP
jgi:cell division septation protein DedD